MHLSACITLTVLFSTTGQAENRDSVWCQSEREHPLFKSTEERAHRLYRRGVIPLRKIVWLKFTSTPCKPKWYEKKPKKPKCRVTFHATAKAALSSGISLTLQCMLFGGFLYPAQQVWHKGGRRGKKRRKFHADESAQRGAGVLVKICFDGR